MGRLTALAGPSGAGKTALVLDSLVPAARAVLAGSAPPAHVRRLDLGGIRQVVQVDASPIGQNARSTPATYSGAFDHIRQEFAASAYARRRRWKPGHFSFNTLQGQCPTCRGLGHIDLDVQYLPDIAVECPTCHGARFNDATLAVRVDGMNAIAAILGLSVDDALDDSPRIRSPPRCGRSEVRTGLPGSRRPHAVLSGGGRSGADRRPATLQPARRAVRLRRAVTACTRSTWPRLAAAVRRLLEGGATIIVIDDDLDLLAVADHLIDMGPGGGRTAAASSPRARLAVARNPASVTGPWLADHLTSFTT